MIIKTDGTYKISSDMKGMGSGTSIVYYSGTPAGCTAKLAYIDALGNTVDLVDGTMTVDNQYKMEHGVGIELYVVVTGATGSTEVDIFSASKV